MTDDRTPADDFDEIANQLNQLQSLTYDDAAADTLEGMIIPTVREMAESWRESHEEV